MNQKELLKLVFGTLCILLVSAAFLWWSDQSAAAAFKEWIYALNVVADHHHEGSPLYLPVIFR